MGLFYWRGVGLYRYRNVAIDETVTTCIPSSMPCKFLVIFCCGELLVPAINPTDMISELKEIQLKMLNTLARETSFIVDKWTFYGFGQFSVVVEVKCNSCKEALHNDGRARWMTAYLQCQRGDLSLCRGVW